MGLAPKVLVGFNPQTPCHGSKEASGARVPSVAAAACPAQGPAPPEGFEPPGMGVSQALALWSTAAVAAAPSDAREGGV